MTSFLIPVDGAHDVTHAPPHDADPRWQESVCFQWHDPVSEFAGYHHLSVIPARGMADVNSYISYRGAVIATFQDLEVRLENADLSDITVGPMSIRNVAPMKRHSVEVRHPEVWVNLDITAAIGPSWMNYPEAQNHWESFGRFSGVVGLDGQNTSVGGYSFLNRSWGPRDYSSILAARVATAIFGEDLVMRSIQVTRPDGYSEHGYVVIGDRAVELGRVHTEYAMASDGVTVKGAEISLWTVDGVGYHLTGNAVDCDIQTQDPGFMIASANSLFECGGRLGVGFLQASELKIWPPATALRRA